MQIEYDLRPIATQRRLSLLKGKTSKLRKIQIHRYIVKQKVVNSVHSWAFDRLLAKTTLWMFLLVIPKITRFWVKLDNQIFQNEVYVPANLQHWQPLAYIFIQHLCNINVFECLGCLQTWAYFKKTRGHTGLLGIVTKSCCEQWRNRTLQNFGYKCKAEEWQVQVFTNNGEEKVLRCDKREVRLPR